MVNNIQAQSNHGGIIALIKFGILLVQTQIQIPFHIANHQHYFAEKADLITERHLVHAAQNVPHFRWEVSHDQRCGHAPQAFAKDVEVFGFEGEVVAGEGGSD